MQKTCKKHYKPPETFRVSKTLKVFSENNHFSERSVADAAKMKIVFLRNAAFGNLERSS